MRLNILAGVQDDLLAATQYYARVSATLGAEFAREVERGYGEILSQPRRYPANEYGERKYPTGRFPFSIVYRVKEKEEAIIVVAVAHHRRVPGYWRERDDL